MQIIKCDVCHDNIADKQFKVKTKNRPFHSSKWKELDICYECYNRFIKLIPEPKSSIEKAIEGIGRAFSEAFKGLPANFQTMRENATDEPEPPDEG